MPKDIKTCLRPKCANQSFVASMEPVHQLCGKCVVRIEAGLLPVPDELTGERDGECQARKCRYHYKEPVATSRRR